MGASPYREPASIPRDVRARGPRGPELAIAVFTLLVIGAIARTLLLPPDDERPRLLLADPIEPPEPLVQPPAEVPRSNRELVASPEVQRQGSDRAPAAGARACNCEPGDPLCSCL
jgi:hypothetical protein